MESIRGDEKMTQQDRTAEINSLPTEQDQIAKQQNNENDNDDAVVYHSLMNAAPEAQEEIQIIEEEREIQLEPEQELEQELEPVHGPNSESKLVTETVTTTNFDLQAEERDHRGINHSESQQEKPIVSAVVVEKEKEEEPEHNVASTNNNTDLSITSTQQADESIFKSSTLSQSSVDAQMEKVIDDIVELGGCQQFGQTLEQQGGVIDKEKEVQDIQREIIGDGNLIIKTHEPMEIHSDLVGKEQHSQVEAEKSADIGGSLPQISDLSSLEEANLELNKEEEEKQRQINERQQREDAKLEKESRENRSRDKERQREIKQQSQEQQQQQAQQRPPSPIPETQKDTNEGQQLPEIRSRVDEPQPPSVSNGEEELEGSLEDQTPKEFNNTADANVDLNLADLTKKDSQGHGEGEKFISFEKEGLEQLIEEPGRRQRRCSSKKIASAMDQSEEENKIQEAEPEGRVERRSSRRIKFSNKTKDEEVEEPAKPTRRKKEQNESKVSEDLTEDKDVSMDEELENEPTEVKDDDSAKEVEEPARGVRRARVTRKSMPAELPKVKLERKPMKRSLEKDDSHDKSLQPMIKTPSRSVGSSARSSTVPSGTKIDHSKLRLSSDFDESKKYQCLNCSYSTDRLNNIVQHKKALCEVVKKDFDKKVEVFKQTLQSPKSNNKRSSR